MDGDLSIVTSHLINVCVLSCFSPVQLCGTLWTVARQVPLSIGFSRQEYWSGLPCPSPGELPDPEMESASLTSPALAGRFFTTSATWEAQIVTPTHKKRDTTNKFKDETQTQIIYLVYIILAKY